MIYNDRLGEVMDLNTLIKIIEKVGRIEIEDIKITADELIINIPSAPPIVIPQTPSIKEKLAEEGIIEIKDVPELDWEPPVENILDI